MKPTASLQSILLFILSNFIISSVSQQCLKGNMLGRGVTEVDKEQILRAHNEYRQQIATGKVNGQPGAEDMLEMVWDDGLADIAQRWADRCVFEHQSDIGENLGLSGNTIPFDIDGEVEGNGFPNRIDAWFNEVKKYRYSTDFSAATGHYTQVVWAETNKVGCGFSYFQDGSKYKRLFVCDYNPDGNVDGAMPYKKGQPSCAKHGLINSFNYNGLCIAGGEYAAQQDQQQNFVQHIAPVQATTTTTTTSTTTTTTRRPRTTRQPVAQNSAKDTRAFTYVWSRLFNRYFKVYSPNTIHKG